MTIYNSRRAFVTSLVSIASIDDERVEPAATGYSLAPGSHRFQVWVERLSKLSFILLHDVYWMQATCGFTLDLPPGSRVELEDVEGEVARAAGERGMYKAVVKVRGPLPGAPGPGVPAECADMELFEHGVFETPHDLAKGGLLCRGDTDCVKPGAVCAVANGYTFGVCAQR